MKFSFINSRGDTINLTDNAYFWLTNVDGQTQGNTDLATLDYGVYDGDIINNVKAQPRTVVLDLKVKTGVNVEEAKRYLFNVVKLKKQGTLELNDAPFLPYRSTASRLTAGRKSRLQLAENPTRDILTEHI